MRLHNVKTAVVSIVTMVIFLYLVLIFLALILATFIYFIVG